MRRSQSIIPGLLLAALLFACAGEESYVKRTHESRGQDETEGTGEADSEQALNVTADVKTQQNLRARVGKTNSTYEEERQRCIALVDEVSDFNDAAVDLTSTNQQVVAEKQACIATQTNLLDSLGIDALRTKIADIQAQIGVLELQKKTDAKQFKAEKKRILRDLNTALTAARKKLQTLMAKIMSGTELTDAEKNQVAELTAEIARLMPAIEKIQKSTVAGKDGFQDRQKSINELNAQLAPLTKQVKELTAQAGAIQKTKSDCENALAKLVSLATIPLDGIWCLNAN